MLFPNNLLPRPRWLTPPWTTTSAPWLDIDHALPADDRARHIDRFVTEVDLTSLRQAYAGRGSAAYPPEMLLRLALFEIHRGRLSPAQGASDCRKDDAVKWLLFGLKPSRSCLYHFRDRVGCHLDDWIRQILRIAKAEGLATFQRASLDGTFEPSRASRYALINDRTLESRRQQLDEAVARDFVLKSTAGPVPVPTPTSMPPADYVVIPNAPTSSALGTTISVTDPVVSPTVERADSALIKAASLSPAPSALPTLVEGSSSRLRWTGKNPATRFLQRQRYHQAWQHLEQRKRHQQETNARRAKCKRRSPERIKVSPTDPEAPLGFDKTKVFCPLYDVQLVCDLDSRFVLGYGVFAAVTDANLLVPALERARDLSGAMPTTVLNDGKYVTIMNLKYCDDHGVTMYSPLPNESEAKRKTAQQIPKREFTWLPMEQTYRCPEGHLLALRRSETRPRQLTETLIEYQYRCPATYCQNCPRQDACTRTPQRGRVINRSEHDDLWDKLRERMGKGESQALYKLRKQTVELQYADLKEHRGLRRFTCFGMKRAQIQVGLLVLVHDGLELLNARRQRQHGTIWPPETA